jgi:Ca2+-activated K+ channel Slowpoke, TrkA_C like domain
MLECVLLARSHALHSVPLYTPAKSHPHTQYQIALPEDAPATYGELLQRLMTESMVCVGLYRMLGEEDTHVMTNPPADLPLRADDLVFVLGGADTRRTAYIADTLAQHSAEPASQTFLEPSATAVATLSHTHTQEPTASSSIAGPLSELATEQAPHAHAHAQSTSSSPSPQPASSSAQLPPQEQLGALHFALHPERHTPAPVVQQRARDGGGALGADEQMDIDLGLSA